MRFVLEAMGYDEVQKLEGYEDFDMDVAMSILEEQGKFCANEMLPLNQTGDQEGIHYDPQEQTITMPKGFIELYNKYKEAGISGLVHPPQYGGSGAPSMLGVMVAEMPTATNKSFSMCPGLTNGLIDAMLHHANDELKDAYLPKLVSGEWAGTMCLTEPHCGTDLGLLKTKAEPQDDHYLITGTKIWITFGEHDLTDNIIHLVLARLPDAPEGIKGISLFLVPKVTLDGERNPIYCGGVEHKMGIHASPTCVMNLENAKGWLVGEPHKGMRAMFVMMNHARLNVGIEGISLAEISYQTAVQFAKDRRQSRSLDPEKRDPNAPADTILVHPDVRRMLLNARAGVEGMRALASYVGKHLDISKKSTDEEARAYSSDIVALLTPIIKSFFTEKGCRYIDDAMQSLGGSGYTTDWCIEQYYRDARIAMIYEGTNHIQALDLVGRKLTIENGRLFRRFNEEITTLIKESKEDERMAEFINPLKKASKALAEVTMGLAMKGMQDPEEIGAVASAYLNLFGFTALAFIYCKKAQYALKKDDAHSKTKLKTARFYMNNMLPEIYGLIPQIEAGKASMMDFDMDEF